MGTAFDQEPGAGQGPQRKMKVLKAARKTVGGEGGGEEAIKFDVAMDVVKTEVRDSGEEQGKGQVASKNVGGGAFHWMK